MTTLNMTGSVKYAKSYWEQLSDEEKEAADPAPNAFKSEYGLNLPSCFKAKLSDDCIGGDELPHIAFTHAFRNGKKFNAIFEIGDRRSMIIDNKYVVAIDENAYQRFITMYFFESYSKQQHAQTMKEEIVEEIPYRVMTDMTYACKKIEQPEPEPEIVNGRAVVCGAELINFGKRRNRYGFVVRLKDIEFSDGANA